MWEPNGNHYKTIDGEWELEFVSGDGFILRRCDSCIIIFIHSKDLINAIAEATVKIMRERNAL